MMYIIGGTVLNVSPAPSCLGPSNTKPMAAALNCPDIAAVATKQP